jgi:hypothetical protein
MPEVKKEVFLPTKKAVIHTLGCRLNQFNENDFSIITIGANLPTTALRRGRIGAF